MGNNQPRVQINVLPVNEGDCIHLRFRSSDGWHNIVVDSGPGSCATKFKTLIDGIRKRGECVDLLCFSHIDNDHVKGAELTFCEGTFETSHIKQIWLNLSASATPLVTVDQLPTYQFITVESAYKLIQSIRARKIPCATKVTEGDYVTIGDITITVILPTSERLDTYYRKFDKDLEHLRERKPYLFIGRSRTDTSQINGSSITLMIGLPTGKVILSGDAFTSDLTAAVTKYAKNEEILLVKLPHHGSDRNISMELLNTLKCRHFIISTETNGDRPSQNTVDLLGDYGKNDSVMLYGNYPWPFIRKPDHGMEIITLSDRRHPIIEDEIVIYTEE